MATCFLRRLITRSDDAILDNTIYTRITICRRCLVFRQRPCIALLVRTGRVVDK